MACRWLHRRFDNTVTFHIIFQGQYLPAGFCWDTVAQYYVDMAKKKAITDQPAEAEEKEKEESEAKRRRVVSDEEWCVCCVNRCVFCIPWTAKASPNKQTKRLSGFGNMGLPVEFGGVA